MAEEVKAYQPAAVFVAGEAIIIAIALLYHYDPYKWFKKAY